MLAKPGLLTLKEYGTVSEIRQDVLSVTGLTNCMNGQLVSLGESAEGVILGFTQGQVMVLIVQESARVRPGDKAVTRMDDFKVPVGEGFLGRRINAFAKPIDGNGPIREDARYPIFNKAPSVLDRIPLTQVLATGTKIIDMMKPVGKGQRMLIIGDRMTGKTTICVDAILNQKGKNAICIYCCIGKAESALNKVTETFDHAGVWDYGLVVAATASDPTGQQYLAPYVATSIGEYFMYEKGADVLVVFDDFSKHAWAYRQISLLLDRPPGRDAYPGDIFYIHSQLVERACKLNKVRKSGSITHLPIVETLQGDIAGYIPSNIVSMTDGQVYMSTTLFGEGFKPAIDMGLSVSRIGNKIQWPAMKNLTKTFQLDFMRYKELQKLTRIKAGVSADTEQRLRKGQILEELLKQDANKPVALEDQIILLYALAQGFFEKIDPGNIKSVLIKLTDQIKSNRPDLIRDLVENQQLTDNLKEGFDEEFARARAEIHASAVQN